MHFPWKKSKSKSGRISRFMSDLQQSPKRGGSLVVETGFPTSLIDLFVKNRDRLKPRHKPLRSDTTVPTQIAPTRPRVLSPPLPQKLDPEDLATSAMDESLVDGSGLATTEKRHGGDNSNEDGGNGGDRGGGCCVLAVCVVKVFAVAVLALSTRKLAGWITISAFALLFLELAVARVFTQLIGKKKKKKKVKQEAEGVEVVEEAEVSSLYSEDTIGSQVSERDETGLNPPLLESCEEVREEGEEYGSKGDATKMIFLVVITLAGLLSGKVLAVVLTLSSCLIVRFVCCRSQTSL
nr:PREDICTED: uncharacterized protein LOC108821983 isoform X2 [Raphanus sativus]